jgi:hypothetical protein
MFDKLPKKRALAVVGLVVMLATAGVAVAYFTSSGSGTGSVTAGTASNWTVTFGKTTGTMYPGAGTSTLPYTVTNPSAGHQALDGTAATVVADGAGDIAEKGVTVLGCKSEWFTATDTGPGSINLAGGDSATGSVAVTMANDASNQDACQGRHPDVTVNVTTNSLGTSS